MRSSRAKIETGTATVVIAKRKNEIVENKDVDDLFRIVKEVRNHDEPLVMQEDGGKKSSCPPRSGQDAAG
jgi:hypothetical protein